MGSVWRNRAFRRQMAAMAATGAVLVPLCFWLNPATGAAASLLFAAMLGLSAVFTRARYRDIARLSAQLEKIAAGVYHIDIAGYTEGELGILASEILKITSALSHQAQSLQRDKVFLADTLADISHQLKTPLTSMSMLADLLESPDLPPDRQREFLSGIRASLDRLQWLIAALLKLSRLDAGAVSLRREDVCLSQVVERAVHPLGVTAGAKGQTLQVEGDQGIRLVTDASWLAEAVGNLVKNCVEHTPQGGHVVVAWTRNPLYTEIRVFDDGPGIPVSDLPRIFERFYRGKNASADSVGIGLALSRSIVQNLGGTLTADNRTQGGARFTVRLYGESPR